MDNDAGIIFVIGICVIAIVLLAAGVGMFG
jgi:hypothetical protein